MGRELPSAEEREVIFQDTDGDTNLFRPGE